MAEGQPTPPPEKEVKPKFPSFIDLLKRLAPLSPPPHPEAGIEPGTPQPMTKVGALRRAGHLPSNTVPKKEKP